MKLKKLIYKLLQIKIKIKIIKFEWKVNWRVVLKKFGG
jgi:hypothetical protein